MSPTNNEQRPNEKTTNSIMNDIEKKSCKNECNDIGNQWIKNCPNCGEEMNYSSEGNLTRSIKENNKCKKCYANSLRVPRPENGWIKLCPECRCEQRYTCKKSLITAILEDAKCNKCSQSVRKIKIPDIGWVKYCPECGTEQKYSCKSALNTALKTNKKCSKCKTKKIIPPNEKYWERICPTCNNDITYKSRKGYLLGIKLNSDCGSCGTKLAATKKDYHWITEEYRNKTSKKTKEQWNTPHVRNKMLDIMKSPEYREKHKINSSNMWKDPSHITHMKLIHESDEYRKKRRLITQQFLKQNYGKSGLISYNKRACEFIDYINKKFNLKFQHATNGGEYNVSGYFLDGYDREKNIVFEYDEKYHYDTSNNLKEKDRKRQDNIIQEISPIEFWRYNERTGILSDVINKKELIYDF